MRRLLFLLALVCCVAMLFSMVACKAETTETTETTENTENTEDISASIVSWLDYVGKKDDAVECIILIKALDSSFLADVDDEDITVKVHAMTDEERTEAFDPEEEYADVSEVTVVSNDGEVLEVSFTIPQGDLSVDAFAVEGYVALADGMLLDRDGKAVGRTAELTVWTMDEAARGEAAFAEHGYATSALTLNHEGSYIVHFYVTWKELTGYKDDGEPILVERSWTRNGSNIPAGFSSVIDMNNAYDISITVQGKTGLAWEPWRTSFCESGLTFEDATLRIYGTTLNQKAVFSCE